MPKQKQKAAKSITGGAFSINREQLAQQLALLGYKKGDTVYLRAFYHKDDLRKVTDKGRKGQAQTLDQLIEIAYEWQAEDRGVYLVVNGGGHVDNQVTNCRAIFYEHDDLDKEISRELWRSLGLPEPTFQVDTGGKSIHSYWVFSDPVDSALWKALQTDLLEYADADRALKNPSRVMRLAGGCHISPNGSFSSVIVAASETKYSFDELRAIIPTPKKEILPSISPMATDMDIPLSECLRVMDRDFIANGEREGRRNDTGAALARNLIGTAARLQILGEHFTGDPRKLFDNYCACCSPPLGAREADQIWKSAQGNNPTATLTDDAIINCIKSWRRRQQALISKTASSNIAQIKTPTEVPLKERISEILSRGLKSSEEKAALLELAKQTGNQSRDIDAFANLLRSDSELEESRDERRQEITELLAIKDDSLDLAQFLPEQLAAPLKQWCRWLSIPQSVALTAVLTTASTLHPVGTELIIHKGMDFSVPPILFSAVVGESGQKKSPVYRTLIKKPLRILQNEAKQKHERQMAQYEIDLAEWEKAPGENGKPQKPGLPIYFFTDATGEGIKTQAQEAPDKAMFALIDELAGLFNSANQYRGGKGSDKQDTLSYYDGLGQTVLRASGIKVDVERIYLSIFGGIQPEVLKEHTKDLKDADGHWARFLFVNQPLAASELPDDESSINLRELLSGYYRRIAMISIKEYKLSRAAFKRFQVVYNKLEQLRVSHPQPGMRAVYSKMEGAIGRLALNLHVLGCAANNAIDVEISEETMRQAIALSEFYINQVRAVHADSRADKCELPALLAKILKLAQSKGKISASALSQVIRNIKNSAEALDHLKELELMQYGEIKKEGKSWVFYPATENPRQNDENPRQILDTQNTSKINTSGRILDKIEKNPRQILDTQNTSKINTSGRILDKIESCEISPEKTCFHQPGLEELKSEKKVGKTEQGENVYDSPESTVVDTNTGVYDSVYDSPENVYDSPESTVVDTNTGVYDSVYDSPENVYDSPDTTVVDTNTGVYDSPLKPLGFSLKVGDRIRCYPTQRHADNKWAVSATVTELETERGWFVGCTVEYRDKKKGVTTVRIFGGCSDWILSKTRQ